MPSGLEKNNRPMVLSILPKPGVREIEPPPYLTAFDCDFHDLAHWLLAWAETHDFVGDTLPYYYLEFGPETFATYLGCDLKLAEDRSTSWSIPYVEDWDKTEIYFHRENYWWQRTLEAVDILRSHLDGKMMIGAPTLLGNLDALSSIRGPQNLLVDLMDHPHQISRALDQVCRVHAEVIEDLAKALDMDQIGSMNVEGLYFSGRHSRPQCDFSAMISPAMFRKYVVPCLESEARDVGAVTYHLDGPNAVNHVPPLCGIEKLDIIIYAIGAGNEEKDWSFLYDQIDHLGKGQIFYYNNTPEKVKQLWKKYRSKKLVFTSLNSSRSEIEDLLAELESIEKP